MHPVTVLASTMVSSTHLGVAEISAAASGRDEFGIKLTEGIFLWPPPPGGLGNIEFKDNCQFTDCSSSPLSECVVLTCGGL